MTSNHRTPLRRVSKGSLRAISRSGAYNDAPQGLEFLEPAMVELADEVETLQGNIEGMLKLSESLATFNESFASWLYVMDMNALVTDWPQAPTPASHILSQRRAEQEAARTLERVKEITTRDQPPDQTMAAEKTGITDGNQTDGESTIVARSTTPAAAKSGKPAGGSKTKKAGKKQMTTKEKRERNIELEKVVNALPLEFRGTDVNLRKQAEAVIEGLLDAPGQTVKLQDLIKPPDLNQAKVNKCLIALVNRKLVQKESSTGVVLYHWKGLP